MSVEIKNYYNEGASYSAVMKLLRTKQVKVNGERVGKDGATKNGDLIEVYFDGSEKPIAEIYGDENILVCYKPSGITSEDFYAKVKAKNPSAGFIHRLDRNTDGLMVFSLGERAESELLRGFKERTFKKYYLAEVYGVPKKSQASLTGYLIKDGERGLVKVYDEPVRGAQKIITEYKTLKSDGTTSLLEVSLVTGKTHQIRAHLAHIGNFVIGDGKYGDERVNRQFRAKGQRLTAYKIKFCFEKSSPLYYLDGKEIELREQIEKYKT